MELRHPPHGTAENLLQTVGVRRSQLGLGCLMISCLLCHRVTPALAQYGPEYGAEMEDEEGYGDDYYGDSYGDGDVMGGSVPGRSGRTIDAAALASGLSLGGEGGKLSSLISFFAPIDESKINRGPELFNDAVKAYQSGDLPLASKLFHAHLAVEYDQASDRLAKVKFSRGLTQPTWHLSFGYSLRVRGEDEVEELNPISGNMTSSGGGYGGGYGGGDPYGGGYGGDDGGYGDDYGDEADGGYGGADPYAGSAMGGGVASSRPAKPEAPPRNQDMLRPDLDERMTAVLGTVAEAIKTEFETRFASGSLGAAFADVEVRQPTKKPSFGRAPTESFQSDFDQNEDLPMWTPGLVFVGEEDVTETLQRASEAGLDYLIHFDIALKQDRNQPVQNRSRVRIIDVRASTSAAPNGNKTVVKTVAQSGKFDNFEVMQDSRNNRRTQRTPSNDSGKSAAGRHIDEAMSGIRTGIDRNIALLEMPTITIDVAQTRVGSLLASPPSDMLRTLAEIRYYQMKGLLNEQEVATAFSILLGDDGLKLLYGTKQERQRIAEKLVFPS